MTTLTQPASGAKSGGPLGHDPGKSNFAEITRMLDPKVATTLLDIAQRSGALVQLYAEQLKSGDKLQAIGPEAATDTFNDFQNFIQKAAADPSPLIREQAALWQDMYGLMLGLAILTITINTLLRRLRVRVGATMA